MEDKKLLAELGVKQLVKNVFAEALKEQDGDHINANELIRKVNSRMVAEVRRLSDEAISEMMAKLEDVLAKKHQ
ncbi:hypothetical protein [Streptomyces sp. BBFR109]|uniref:hypothetical protein n=1 Tax=Streptomyces sp. BBFR109 TaxID=3448172 RepID=UPI003F7605A0